MRRRTMGAPRIAGGARRVIVNASAHVEHAARSIRVRFTDEEAAAAVQRAQLDADSEYQAMLLRLAEQAEAGHVPSDGTWEQVAENMRVPLSAQVVTKTCPE